MKCVYCGDQATCVDHIIPRSFQTEKLRGRYRQLRSSQDKNLVPACNECNILAGNRVFDSFNDKKEFIRTRLRVRYADVLGLPYWSESELKELSSRMSGYVKRQIAQKEILEMRLAYEKDPW